MFIADTYTNIKERENYPVEFWMIERLDEMLNKYNVKHFFTMPIESTNGIANDDSHVFSVAYCCEDKMTFRLVYVLWSKTVRGYDDEIIAESLRKTFGDGTTWKSC